MKKCKECGREEWGFLSSLNKDGYCPTCAIKHNQDKIKRLQEQLKEANEVIKATNRVSGNIDLSQMVYEDRRKVDGITMQTGSYIEKWGIK